MAEKGILSRADRRHYLNIGTEDAPVWSLIGEGFTEFTERKNAVRYRRRYIHESVSRTDVTGYAPTVEYELELSTDNPAAERLRRIADRELLGRDAWVQICTVDLFAQPEAAGVCRAAVRTYSVIPDACAKGTEALLYTGTLCAVTAPVEGMFVVSTAFFTKG